MQLNYGLCFLFPVSCGASNQHGGDAQSQSDRRAFLHMYLNHKKSAQRNETDSQDSSVIIIRFSHPGLDVCFLLCILAQ